MTLCYDCICIPIDDLRDVDIPWKADLRELINSAEDGCPLCQMCWTGFQQDCKEDISEHLTALADENKQGLDLQIYMGLKFNESEYDQDRVYRDGRAFSPCAIEVRIGPTPCSEDPHFAAIRSTQLDVFAKPGTLAARYVRGRNFVPLTDFAQCLPWVKQSLSECEIHHKGCEASVDTEMPTRVVDIGTPESKCDSCVLETNGQLGRYMALSYCWGDGVKHQVKLKKSTYAAMIRGIDYALLTRSHREALQIARELGYQYVWIDALCIIQDDPADWERESSRMTECYQNANLTLVAGRSGNSSNGFIETGFKLPANPVQIDYSHPDAPDEKGDLYLCLPRRIETGPVDERAWCYQEDVLSRRKLIFGLEQLFFECPSRSFLESGIVTNFSAAGWTERIRLFELTKFATMGDDPSAQKEKLLLHWYDVVGHYSARSMFEPHDIFAALMGVAKAIQRVLHSRYLAGLWEDDIIRGLLWQSLDDTFPGGGYPPLRRPTERNTKKPLLLGLPAIRSPSWSWASVEGPVCRASGENDKTMFDVGNLCVKPVYRNPTRWTRQTNCDTTKAFMPVCELEMLGAPKEVLCSTSPIPKEIKEDAKWRQSFAGAAMGKFAALVGVKQSSHIIGMGLFDVEQERTDSLWCMCLVKDRGLLLRMDQDGKFHRLGKFVVLDEAWFHPELERRVSLV